MGLFVTVLINLCWSVSFHIMKLFSPGIAPINLPILLFWNLDIPPPSPTLGVDDHAALITLKKPVLHFLHVNTSLLTK